MVHDARHKLTSGSSFSIPGGDLLLFSGATLQTATFSSTFNVVGTEEINGADTKCVYSISSYGYTEETKIVKTYIYGKMFTNIILCIADRIQ